VTVAGDIAAVTTVANDLNEPVSEIETVATNIANVNTVGTNISSVNTTAANNTNITTVATNIANVGTVATNIANVNSVAGNATNINAVAGNSTNINAVATNSTNINTAATNIAAITTVANDLNEPTSEIDVVANNIASVNTVGTNIADVSTVAGVAGNVNTVAGIAPNVTIVAGISANVTTVASISTAVTDVAAIDTDVTTVAAIDSDVTAVAGVAADIPTVAANVADISNFADVYQGAKSTPPTLRNDGSALQIGDLYFNSVSNAMFVYASTGWVPAGSSVNGTSRRFRYIATASQTTFTGTDSNGNTLAYDAGFVDVYLNGVRLDQTDYTASSGTSIVLGSAAALNDELNIVAFGTFSVASINGVDLINGTVTPNKLSTGAPTWDTSGNVTATTSVQTPKVQSSSDLTIDSVFSTIFKKSGATTATLNQFGFGLGGATLSSGIGIGFPASQSASSNANTLDDYEEGTFTPNLVNNGGTSTWAVKVGRYVKIGAQINFWCYFDAGGAGSGGALILSGLPFVGSGTNSTMSTVGTIQVNTVQNWYPAFQNASTNDCVIYAGGSQVIGPSISFCVVQGSYNSF